MRIYVNHLNLIKAFCYTPEPRWGILLPGNHSNVSNILLIETSLHPLAPQWGIPSFTLENATEFFHYTPSPTLSRLFTIFLNLIEAYPVKSYWGFPSPSGTLSQLFPLKPNWGFRPLLDLICINGSCLALVMKLCIVIREAYLHDICLACSCWSVAISDSPDRMEEWGSLLQRIPLSEP